MMMATAMRISGANTMRRTRLLTSGLWPQLGGRVAATGAVQPIAHAANDDRAASDPVEIAIQNDASSVCPVGGKGPETRKPAFRSIVRSNGLMELGGLEPPTSWVRSRRSPN